MPYSAPVATMTFRPRRLAQFRATRGMTQNDVAYELRRRHGMKADQAQIARWESGQHTPRAGVIPAIADVLGVSIDQLYGDGEDDEEEADALDLVDRAIKALADHREYDLAAELQRRVSAEKQMRKGNA